MNTDASLRFGDPAWKWFVAVCLCCGAAHSPGQTYEEQVVAAVLMGEAWSEGKQGMTAVAEVIHQRAKEKGRTPLQVVSAHRGRVHAFSCLNGTTPDDLIAKFRPKSDYQTALQIARTACHSPNDLPGITKAANHFTRTDEKPYWAEGQQPVAIIGQHAFYRLERY
jgi:N-acetylmuramoyl-L-alanine amidase